jgi:hypothetical protein
MFIAYSPMKSSPVRPTSTVVKPSREAAAAQSVAVPPMFVMNS